MIRSHAAAILLSAGAQTPLAPALIALGFVILRAGLVLGLPGLVLYTAAQALAAWWSERATGAATE